MIAKELFDCGDMC